MGQNLQEKIEDLQFQTKRMEGHSLIGNIGNRVYGIFGLYISTLATYHIPWLAPISVPFSIEMIGDIATGKHHFISSRLLKMHPKYELERLMTKSYTSTKYRDKKK